MSKVFKYRFVRSAAVFCSIYAAEQDALAGDVIANPFTGHVNAFPDGVMVPREFAHDVSRYLIRLGWSLGV